ncbi:ornithine carbamoyltransferase [Brucepastera parasyntrophica]|uniref:ornithine carbamoyltransferase n=1 Tax=Brucepastera parasyntrophica TaxID=2880008 RepID=UPI00210A5E6D|nr:ornithine carbamoyltransferase [Brucepastera parasyntrophica]ULQ59766.1 ornithine carbamoyltransferase [Brucepastera parasyntrophica]
MYPASLKGRSLLTWKDWTPEEIRFLLELSHAVKKSAHNNDVHQRFRGKTLAMIFEKRSTRTRCAFETSFSEEGGHPVFLSTHDIQLGAKESIEDTARVLGRMFSAIEFRGYKQSTVEILARESGVPVYNGLTDLYHPTQVLADVMTLEEVFRKHKGLKLCYVGDGRNNVARSLIIISSKLGINCTIVSPKELFTEQALLDECAVWAKESGAEITVTDDLDAVSGANAVYTDVWVSMGEEAESEMRRSLLLPYQVNEDLMKKTGNAACIFLHCLPAIKGEEVTVPVVEGSQSRVWDQAENRKHTIKAIMLATLMNPSV